MKNKKYIILLSIFVVALIGIIIGVVLKNNTNEQTQPQYSKEYLETQKIFNFYLSEDRSYYTISGLKSAYQNEHTLKIPNTIDNIPVKKLIDNIHGNFDSWKNIRIIIIPANIEYIGTKTNDLGVLNNGTYGDSFLTAQNSQTVAINVDKDNKVYASIDGILFSKDLSVLIRYPNSKYQEGGRLIYNVPESVTRIHDKAFYYNSRLTTINLSSSLKKIGKDAFNSCKELNQIGFNNQLEIIETDAFRNCNIQQLLLPSSITTIKSRAFSYNEELVEVFIDVNAKELGRNIFSSCSNSLIIYTPKENVNYLKEHDNFKMLIILEAK